MKTRLSLTTLALGLCSPALAQTSAPLDADRDEIVITASRLPLEPREVGSAYTVVKAAEIERGQYIFLNTLLQDVPGVQVTTDRPGDMTSVSIRGSANDQVLYLVDGIELGDPSVISTQYQVDHLITQDIDRIEILRGNQSSLYGSDAIGGVVNIVTKRAERDGFDVAAEAEYGSYDTWNGGASILGKTGPLDVRVTATGYQHDGPSLTDPAPGTEAEDDAYSRYGFSGRAGLEVSPNLELQLIGYWLDADTDLDNTASDSSDTAEVEEFAVAATGRFASDDDSFSADVTASRYDVERVYFGQYNSPDGDVYEGTKNVLSLDLAYAASDLLQFAAGANYEEERTEQVTLFSGEFDASIDTKSVYGEVALFPAEGLTLTGAARLDDNSRFGSYDTYRATAAYLIADVAGGTAKLRGSFGTGAKAPGLYQLFDPSYGNAELEVETSEGGDVGIDLDFGSLTAQASVFFTKVTNEIVFDGTRPPFGGYAQLGRTRSSGIELAFALQPLEGLTLTQSYTYVSAEEASDDTGDYSDIGRPEHSGTTALTVSPRDRFSVTARVRFSSDNAAAYGGETDGFVVTDLLGSLPLTDEVELFGRVTNLFDNEYQVQFGKNALGRSAYGGVRVNF
ncbi:MULTISPECIES: TonB-dependent receptor plug domain-containing protein [Pacificimonas]|uniref:TonB-dependent receptor n=1 Tax=Pacificimonas aurantium TaxID=1250540 RepID=A0ABS7WL08_9SPHN|nr:MULTISPECIES: TonB-dependent receptor [Pacificimonas]MBZ6378303.1 TonB-dependent receptor [Pacificimonas aurantium]